MLESCKKLRLIAPRDRSLQAKLSRENKKWSNTAYMNNKFTAYVGCSIWTTTTNGFTTTYNACIACRSHADSVLCVDVDVDGTRPHLRIFFHCILRSPGARWNAYLVYGLWFLLYYLKYIIAIYIMIRITDDQRCCCKHISGTCLRGLSTVFKL